MTLKDEEKTIKGILKGIMKSDKYWLENIANFTYNQKGGSAKGWAFEESSFRQLEDTAVDITRAGSMEPNTDYHVNVCNDVIPIQAKAYTMKTPSSKAGA